MNIFKKNISEKYLFFYRLYMSKTQPKIFFIKNKIKYFCYFKKYKNKNIYEKMANTCDK